MSSVAENDTLPAAAVTCSSCRAVCCRLQVLLFDDPDVSQEMVEISPWGGQVMRRLEDGWCVALDRHSWRCSVYDTRPQLCRDYTMGGSECIDERRLSGDLRIRPAE